MGAKEQNFISRVIVRVDDLIEVVNELEDLQDERNVLNIDASVKPEDFVGELDHVGGADIVAALNVYDDLRLWLATDDRLQKLYRLRR